MMKKNSPPITKELVQKYFYYNEDIGGLYWKKQQGYRRPNLIGQRYGKTRMVNGRLVRRGTFFGQHFREPKLVWIYHHGPVPDGYVVFHDRVNRDVLDCPIEYLKLMKKGEHIRYVRRRSQQSSTGFRGVYRNHKKYLARITCKSKTINLGNYNTPEEAARVYDQAAIKYFKSGMPLNFPEESWAEYKKGE